MCVVTSDPYGELTFVSRGFRTCVSDRRRDLYGRIGLGRANHLVLDWEGVGLGPLAHLRPVVTKDRLDTWSTFPDRADGLKPVIARRGTRSSPCAARHRRVLYSNPNRSISWVKFAAGPFWSSPEPIEVVHRKLNIVPLLSPGEQQKNELVVCDAIVKHNGRYSRCVCFDHPSVKDKGGVHFSGSVPCRCCL